MRRYMRYSELIDIGPDSQGSCEQIEARWLDKALDASAANRNREGRDVAIDWKSCERSVCKRTQQS